MSLEPSLPWQPQRPSPGMLARSEDRPPHHGEFWVAARIPVLLSLNSPNKRNPSETQASPSSSEECQHLRPSAVRLLPHQVKESGDQEQHVMCST